MMTAFQLFRRTFDLLNSLLIVVLMYFIVERLGLSIIYRMKSSILQAIVLCCTVLFLSGLSGCVLEVVSGEEKVFQSRRLIRNVKALWLPFGMVLALAGLVDFFIFYCYSAGVHWRPIYYCLLAAITIYVLVALAVRNKYLMPLNIPFRWTLSPQLIAVICAAMVLDMAVTYYSGSAHIAGFRWMVPGLFVSQYIHVFEFIAIAVYLLDAYQGVYQKYESPNEIYLINPMSGGVIASLGLWCLRGYPPLFVVLKALTPKGYRFREFNRVFWHPRYYKAGVLVCITSYTSNCHEAYKIAKEFKQRGSTVVMGGPHATYLPDEALEYCDSVVIGPAEGAWRQVVHDYENGALQKKYCGTPTEEDYDLVRRELMSSPPHVIRDFMEASRGCKFRCSFCTIPSLAGGKVYNQAIETVVALVKKIKTRYKSFGFIDNNIYSDPAYAKELFKALKPLNVIWQTQCTIDIAKNKEVLRLARESGCRQLMFGYEIYGESKEKGQGGKFGMAKKYIEYSKLVKKEGIRIKAHYIFGFDTDSWGSLFALWRFCFSIMPSFTVVSLLTPLPGSVYYQQMLDHGRIINLNWRAYSVNRMVISHPRMDHRMLCFLFPILQALFLLTTSTTGLFLLLVLCWAIL